VGFLPVILLLEAAFLEKADQRNPNSFSLSYLGNFPASRLEFGVRVISFSRSFFLVLFQLDRALSINFVALRGRN